MTGANVAYGTAYTYIVRADSGIGEGPAASITVGPFSAPPLPVTGVEVFAEGIGFRLWWDAPDTQKQQPVTAYHIHRELVGYDEIPDDYVIWHARQAPYTLLDYKGFRPEAAPYRYHVKAMNANGVYGPVTITDIITHGSAMTLNADPPDARPRDFNVSGKDGTSTMAYLTWKAPNREPVGVTEDHTLGFKIDRRIMSSTGVREVLTTIQPPATTGWYSYTDQPLEPGRYLYWIQGYWTKDGEKSIAGNFSRWVELRVPTAERIAQSGGGE